jgi:predicted kinase
MRRLTWFVGLRTTPWLPMPLAPTLHFFCGKPGAGKSTVALRISREHAAILISEDIWMTRLFGDRMKTFDDYIHFSPKLKAVVGPLATQLLSSGKHVVLDFQANTKASRAFFRSVFEQANAAHVLHFVQSSDQVCLERIARRNIERPEGSHHLTDEVFALVSSYFQPPEATEGFNIEVHSEGSCDA